MSRVYKLVFVFFKFVATHFKLLSFLVAASIAGLVIQQSVFFRWFGYETVPGPITDEYSYVWQALSLRQHQVPMGWTLSRFVYDKPEYHSRGGDLDGFGIITEGKKIGIKEFKQNSTPLVAIKQIDYVKGIEHMFFVAPFFDHPPLGGLIYSLGVKDTVEEVEQVKPSDFRQPAMTMAIITAVLLFIFLYLVTSNHWIAALGSIIYSTVPTYLLATRSAFLENTVPPFILAHLILLFLAIKSYGKITDKKLNYLFLILSGFAGGLGVLAKEPAAGFVAGSLVLLVINKLPKKLMFMFLISAAIPVLAYIGWGLWLQKDVFIDIFLSNANKGYFGSLKVTTMLEALKFKDFPVDGWWVWGIISFLIISMNIKQKNLLFLIIPLASHLLLILFLGSPNYPWYFLSAIPFLAGCSAILIWQIYESPTIATSFAFFLIPFSSSYYWGRVALNLQPSITHYRWSFLVFVMALFVRLKFGKYRVVQVVWFVFLAILIQKIVVFNQVFFPYLIAHWGNLPIPSLPNF